MTDPRIPVHGNLIDGTWQEAMSGELFPSTDPADGRRVLAAHAASGPGDIAEAVAAARRAQPAWRATPAPRRGEILFRFAGLLAEHKERLALQVVHEMGKVLAEARGDVQEAIDIAYLMAGEGRRMAGETVRSELPDKWAMSVREPLGVAGLITPWNFPTAIPMWKAMPALVAGNTIVLKPASATPGCAVLLAELLVEAGFPPGTVNLVTGSGEMAGAELVDNPDVPVISFTGSAETGRTIAARAGRRLKRLSLELGGKNAILVAEDADLELAVEGILWSAFGTTGQRCTAASRVIVVDAVADRLVERLVERTRALRVGPGIDPATEVGPLISAAARERTEAYLGIGIADGARHLCGGERPADPALAHGWYLTPAILDGVDPMSRVGQEEVFGPLLSIIRVPDLDAAVPAANQVAYGLSSSIYTQDLATAFRMMSALTTGLVYVNAGTIGAETHLPFGGMRASGNGHREAGHAALDTYTEWKAIYVDYSGRLQRAQIDNQPAPGDGAPGGRSPGR